MMMIKCKLCRLALWMVEGRTTCPGCGMRPRTNTGRLS